MVFYKENISITRYTLRHAVRVFSLFIVLYIILAFAQKTYIGEAEAVTNCSVTNTILSQTPPEQTLLNLINEYRQQSGVPALAWSSTLKLAAAWMSNDMASRNILSHTDSLGRDPRVRMNDCGYTGTAYGENIFPNSSDPQVAFTTWKNSAAHNEAMLNPVFKEAGMAVKNNYWTLNLGSTAAGSITTTPIPTSSLIPNLTGTPTRIPTITPTFTPTPTPSIIINPTNTRIKLSIKLTGVGTTGNTNPKHLTRLTYVDIYNLDNKKVKSGNGYLKYNNKDAFEGTINLGQLPNGVYYFKVYYLGTLTSLITPEFQNINSADINVLPSVKLNQGDINFDNVIDIYDFNLALPCFQDIKCDTSELIDFNDDGAANVIDYNIFLASFKRFAGD